MIGINLVNCNATIFAIVATSDTVGRRPRQRNNFCTITRPCNRSRFTIQRGTDDNVPVRNTTNYLIGSRMGSN